MIEKGSKQENNEIKKYLAVNSYNITHESKQLYFKKF